MAVKTDNRTVGGRFEQEMAEILAAHGFWVHVMQQNKAGQPADLIAVKGKFHTLIDCKVVSNLEEGFPFKNIQDNQRMAMRKFTRCSGELCYFAIRLRDGKAEDDSNGESVRLVSMSRIETLENRGHKSITPRMMDTETWALESWLESSRTWAEDV